MMREVDSKGRKAASLLIGVVSFGTTMMLGLASSASAQDQAGTCGTDVAAQFDPVDEGVRTIALGRKTSVFNVKPIEYKVTNCRLAGGAWPLAVYGATLDDEDFRARLVAKTTDRASVIFERLDPKAFPPGTAELSLASSTPDVSFATSIIVTRQYTSWHLVALACLGASIIGFVVLAFRAAVAGSGIGDFAKFFTELKNYSVLIPAVPAVYGVYRAQYEQATAWEGLGSEFMVLAATACGAFIAAGTAATAATGVGAKVES